MGHFLAQLEASLAATTVADYRFYLVRFLDFCRELGVGQLHQLREEHLVAYHRHLLHRIGRRGPVSSTFRHKSLQRARAFLAWAREGGHLLQSWELALPRQTTRPPRVLSVTLVRSLLELPDQATPLGLRDRLLLELFYVLGLRRRECARLDLDHVTLGRREVLVHGKAGDLRLLPLSFGLLTTLADYLERGRPELGPALGERALLLSVRGRRLGSGSLYSIVRGYGRRLGVSLHPHQLRHACAVHLLEAGADIRFIQELLGHRCATTTGRYARVQTLELHREFRRCHPRAHFHQEDDHDRDLPQRAAQPLQPDHCAPDGQLA